MVSVVIPTYNASEYLPRLLLSLQQQTIPLELIILDSESTDNTREILNLNNVPYTSISKSSFNHGATRNIGINLASHEIVMFLTQDAIPYDCHSLRLLYDSLVKTDCAGMAYGRQIPYPNTGIFGAAARLINYSSESIVKNKAMIPTLGITTCSSSNSFAAYKKELLLQHGGFPEHTILGEEVSVAARLILQGYSLVYCAEAKVYHSHDYSILQEFSRYFDIGVFHKQQQHVLCHYEKAESGGYRYVINESQYLIKQGHSLLIPVQILRVLMKYLGYKIGTKYTVLPLTVSRSLSMHKSFWTQIHEK
ncbi:glycosyltransferase family 2 protein [Fibrivirga algicola]|uniref:Glycosyltransferase n=1 Tax=Fibrivirga algicola TaxID=2950420 RepID=A0ABX0QHX6_9BACT|nr:glycosyltransferase [Fibrivirga algicola]NID11652.1 glycosyltransferase [Fibrivirga algicola]